MKQATWMAVVGVLGLCLTSRAMAQRVIAINDRPAIQMVADKATTETDDVLEFLNKDKLHGTLLGVSTEEYGLKWKHVRADKPIDFALTSAARATLAARKITPGTPGKAAVYLTNGDMLPGNIVSLDADKLVLDTWYAGKIDIRRLMIASILPNLAVPALIYQGPGEPADWTVPRGYGDQTMWRFKNGAMYALQSYPLGRDIPGMPDAADIRFDAAWRSAYPQFSFMFFTDNFQEPANGYILQISGSSISLQRISRSSGSRSLDGNVNYEAFQNGVCRNATFNLLVDKSLKTFTLLINGKRVSQWTEPTDLTFKGTGLSFRSNNNGDLKISNISIRAWDGKTVETVGARLPPKDDMVRLANNDKISGRLKAIIGDTVKFETSYAALDIPLAQVAEISTSGEKSERARRNKEDVRAYFSDKGLVTLQLDRIDKDEIKGQSENYGKITLPLGALRLLEFNIYEEKPADETDAFAF